MSIVDELRAFASMDGGDLEVIDRAADVTQDLIAACIEARVWLLGHESAERQIALLDAAIAKATGEQA